MRTAHVLLGRSWQHDRHFYYNALNYTCNVTYNGFIHMLKPLLPKQVEEIHLRLKQTLKPALKKEEIKEIKVEPPRVELESPLQSYNSVCSQTKGPQSVIQLKGPAQSVKVQPLLVTKKDSNQEKRRIKLIRATHVKHPKRKLHERDKAESDLAYLSCIEDLDSRTNPFQEGENNRNQDTWNPIRVYSVLITTTRAKHPKKKLHERNKAQSEYLDFSDPTYLCPHYGALFWLEERVNKSVDALDESNAFVKTFRNASAHIENNPTAEIKIKLIGKRSKDARTYNLSQVQEVAALIVGDIDPNMGQRDILVETNSGNLQRINELNPSYLPLQYPLLYPYGEDGYREDIPFADILDRASTARNRVGSDINIIVCKKVVTGSDINIIVCKKCLADALTNGEVDPTAQGKRIILPSSFTGGARYMIQNYQDAMAICKAMVLYTIEFQKRVLPHAHILVFLAKNDSPKTPKDIDMWISAEIPNEICDPEYYKVVEEFMMHGPYGSCRKNSPCMSRSIKYLFKYVNKGNDRVTAEFYNSTVDESTGKVVDEIKMYYDCRYISPCEAAWRIFSFDIQFRNPSVERLSFHLPNEQSIIFDDGNNVDNVVNCPTVSQSMFTVWFAANLKYEDARQLTYSEMPRKFVWKKDKREWGPRSFEEIKFVDGKQYMSFRDACYARGLIEEDKEYVDAILEASLWATAYSLRKLFVMLLTSSSMSKPEIVWEAVWIHLAEDAEYQARKTLGFPVLTDTQKKNYALLEIDKLLSSCNKSLQDYPPMHIPDGPSNSFLGNRLLYEELSYDQRALKEEHDLLVKGEIVLNVASSGIASLLLPGGRTAHSRFVIPICVNENSTCNIKQGGDFRQILPVIPKGTRQDIVQASINSSYLWNNCEVLRLTKNLRLRSITTEEEIEKLDTFAKWIADLGDGKLGVCIANKGDPIKEIVVQTFPSFGTGVIDPEQLKSRAILAPTLDVVDQVNEYMNNLNLASSKTYLSCDSVCKADTNDNMLAEVHTTEFLNSLKCFGVPNHSLSLKVGSPIMLLRNIDHFIGLCNGTRLMLPN
ncbi:uncharacterized protein LOC115999462 [Ipomoea triloba]|uniref:uncharacterized protein LOC115999462 n=1 Tax=Ipomoea triloba TaxID=35885 RepID=UPI00125D171F|nr:uncharacterized protein LOC115999462 [Ipomoea triloba]